MERHNSIFVELGANGGKISHLDLEILRSTDVLQIEGFPTGLERFNEFH
jgi:hypothetical protein